MTAIKKKGLGRGLEALLGASDKPITSNQGVAILKLAQLQAGKYQPRKNMVDGPLQELWRVQSQPFDVESIRLDF